MGQFHWEPASYLDLMRAEVPDYDSLQSQLVAASAGVQARTILELGTGTGETARRLLRAHPAARLVGVDSSEQMLAAARRELDPRRVELRLGRIEDPLPAGRFDLVVSALAVHHLEGEAKAELFARVGDALEPGGRFVLADCVVPESPDDAVTPIDPDYDHPSTVAEQLGWLERAGLAATVAWRHRDLAVLVGEPVASRAGRPRGGGAA
jgi:tRNA (cmo5U34)-methyltransferase